VVSAFGLSGSAAAALTDVVDPGRGALTPAQPLTVVSAVLLLVSVLGFARTLQRTHLAAWDLPARASAARDWPEVGHDARNSANLGN